MELVVLFLILALLIFAPRRGGRMPSKIAMALGAALLLWLLAAFGVGAILKRLFGTIQQP